MTVRERRDRRTMPMERWSRSRENKGDRALGGKSLARAPSSARRVDHCERRDPVRCVVVIGGEGGGAEKRGERAGALKIKRRERREEGAEDCPAEHEARGPEAWPRSKWTVVSNEAAPCFTLALSARMATPSRAICARMTAGVMSYRTLQTSFVSGIPPPQTRQDTRAGSRDIRKNGRRFLPRHRPPQRHKRGVIATAVSCYVIVRPDEQSAHVPRGGQHITKVSREMKKRWPPKKKKNYVIKG